MECHSKQDNTDQVQLAVLDILDQTDIIYKNVYNRSGKLVAVTFGLIYDIKLPLNKYMIVSFLEFRRREEEFFLIPKRLFSKISEPCGYIIEIDRSFLNNAPNFGHANVPDWSTSSYYDIVDDYYYLL